MEWFKIYTTAKNAKFKTNKTFLSDLMIILSFREEMSLARYTYLGILLSLMPVCPVLSQEPGNGIDSLYGFDPVLYNGRHYRYQPPTGATGNQYLFTSGFEQGCIAVRGKSYCNLALNYDLLNQALLLKYKNQAGANVVIEIPDAWLEYVRIGYMCMEPARRQDGQSALCQVIGSGPVKVRYYRRKELVLDNVYGSPVYVFTEPVREQFVFILGQEYPYHKNREFVRAFDASVQIKIGNYLKSNNIKLRKATDDVVADLVEYCHTQVNP